MKTNKLNRRGAKQVAAAPERDHLFRLSQVTASRLQATKRLFAERQKNAFRDWSEYRREKRVIEDALAQQWIDETKIDARVKGALASLRKRTDRTVPTLRDGPSAGPPIFQVKPGINVLAPPYDVGLDVAQGSNTPSVQVSTSSGRFGVVATAIAGKETFGSAGVALFIVPSDPARTLSIRPYFEWRYIYSCDSYGPPTAHSYGIVNAEATGHRGDALTGFPGKSQSLWSTGSDAWHDTHGDDSDVFRNPDSELVVSGHDYYTVSYVCQTGADSGRTGFGSYSSAYVQFHCRVPFIFVEEF